MVGFAVFMLAGLAALVVAVGAVMAWVMVHPPRRTLGVAVARGNPTDPAEARAASYETVTVAAEDGVAMEVWVAEGRASGGPVVVLVHGWGDSRFGSLLWYEAVGPVASQVAMYDLRGHGDAGHGRFAWGRCEVDDLLRVVEAMGRLYPERAVVVMGLSMGAMVAIDAAAMAGEDARAGLIAGVVADSPFVRPAEVVGRMCRALGLPHWPMSWVALAMLGVRWPGMLGFDTAERAARVRVPMLVMVGDRDRVAPPADARRVAEAAGARATLRVFEGVGHVRGACGHGARYTEALSVFLASYEANGAVARVCVREPGDDRGRAAQ